MKYYKFKSMMKDIRDEVNYLSRLPGPADEAGMVNCVTDMVIFSYFWNNETDMPTCNYDQMKIVIQNTVRKLLHA